jgi:hypothetical protein
MTGITDNFGYNSSSGSSSSSSSSNLPSWYLNSGQKSSNYFDKSLAGLPTQGYQGNRVAGLSPLQQAGLGQGQGYLDQSSPLYGQGAGLMGQAGQQMSNAGVWNEQEMMQHMNPYLTGALNTMTTMSNRNLMENVLPQVNSTFAGNGQFGSTRNADFTNRALRDNQDSINNSGATMMNNAYGQAATDYLNWGQLGTQNAQNMGTLAQNMGQYGITGLNTGMNLGQQDQAAQQAALDAQKAQWTENYTFPLENYGALSQAYNASLGRLVPNQNQSMSQSNSSSNYTSQSGVTV